MIEWEDFSTEKNPLDSNGQQSCKNSTTSSHHLILWRSGQVYDMDQTDLGPDGLLLSTQWWPTIQIRAIRKSIGKQLLEIKHQNWKLKK